jgi:hypothetical protein
MVRIGIGINHYFLGHQPNMGIKIGMDRDTGMKEPS